VSLRSIIRVCAIIFLSESLTGYGELSIFMTLVGDSLCVESCRFFGLNGAYLVEKFKTKSLFLGISFSVSFWLSSLTCTAGCSYVIIWVEIGWICKVMHSYFASYPYFTSILNAIWEHRKLASCFFTSWWLKPNNLLVFYGDSGSAIVLCWVVVYEFLRDCTRDFCFWLNGSTMCLV
jgi:hypothetical protein